MIFSKDVMDKMAPVVWAEDTIEAKIEALVANFKDQVNYNTAEEWADFFYNFGDTVSTEKARRILNKLVAKGVFTGKQKTGRYTFYNTL